MSASEKMQVDNTSQSDQTVEASILRSGHDRALGLHKKLIYYYREFKLAEQANKAQGDKAVRQRMEFLSVLIELADSFEHVFQMFEDSRKLRKQKEALECFKATYHLLEHTLEAENIHQVDVLGKSYDEVEYHGTHIPEPWKVVVAGDVGKREKARVGKKDGKARKVQRGLWIQVKNDRLIVLQRAEVIY